MRYFHDKEQSAEILRRTLKLMRPFNVGFHPISYAVWYEHAAQLNPSLSRDLEKLMRGVEPMSDVDMIRLHALHIAFRDLEAFEHAQAQLRDILENAASSASSARTAAAQFTRTLEHVSRRLEDSTDAFTVRRLAGELMRSGRDMLKIATTFTDQLGQSQVQVETVIERMENAHAEPLRDPLTGINNRQGFQRTANALGRTVPHLGGVALLTADVDHFKKINDTHGHVIGDKVLSKVASVLRTHLRLRDVVARMGGDEFVALLPSTSLEEITQIAERVRIAVARLLISRQDGTEYPGQVSLSIGVAVGRSDDSLESLRHRADVALYRSKDCGRNRVTVCGSEAPEVAEETASRSSEYLAEVP